MTAGGLDPFLGQKNDNFYSLPANRAKPQKSQTLPKTYTGSDLILRKMEKLIWQGMNVKGKDSKWKESVRQKMMDVGGEKGCLLKRPLELYWMVCILTLALLQKN